MKQSACRSSPAAGRASWLRLMAALRELRCDVTRESASRWVVDFPGWEERLLPAADWDDDASFIPTAARARDRLVIEFDESSGKLERYWIYWSALQVALHGAASLMALVSGASFMALLVSNLGVVLGFAATVLPRELLLRQKLIGSSARKP